MFAVVISLLMTAPYLMEAVSSAPAYGRCADGWREWGDSCYMNRMTEKRNWHDAKEICQSYGGNIPTINSKSEHDFAWAQFQGSFPDGIPDIGFWIDCTDKAVEGDWVCTGDGDSPYRPDWLDGSLDENQDCAVVSKFYKFNDLDCNLLRYVICERPAPPRCHNSVSCYSVFHGRCLVNHTLDVMSVERPVQCCLACNETPGCRSFNVAGGDLCELNNATRYDVDGKRYYQEREDCIYYEK